MTDKSWHKDFDQVFGTQKKEAKKTKDRMLAPYAAWCKIWGMDAAEMLGKPNGTDLLLFEDFCQLHTPALDPNISGYSEAVDLCKYNHKSALGRTYVLLYRNAVINVKAIPE